ncbi:hypothetical protein BGX27_007873 [Mortierella sp. AM989]|nr:hypothetical protein BGX27_007873 [Mortierella sp. AM989]
MAEALKHSGGGLELVVRSSLPVGSGMGTSSILAAAILAVLKTLKGEPYSTDDILYLTQEVEQMMNTGGGWQDQVGGILPGFKSTTCEIGLPIQIKPNTLDLSDDFIKDFESRLLLIYTGKTRLAKNLLQTVLMNWAGQDEAVVDTMHRLVKDATQCEVSLREGNMADVGAIFSRYYADKRFLSNTTLNHPPTAGVLIRHLNPYIEGASLAGAGGGGFLVAFLKPNLSRNDVVAHVRCAMNAEKKSQSSGDQSLESDVDTEDDQMWAWQATVDTIGLVVQIGEDKALA